MAVGGLQELGGIAGESRVASRFRRAAKAQSTVAYRGTRVLCPGRDAIAALGGGDGGAHVHPLPPAANRQPPRLGTAVSTSP
jgi:hypothetical protein